ncbi:MAG: TAT-variant-translocated molybdopterin oxidoreductase [Bacteroidota bacterium]
MKKHKNDAWVGLGDKNRDADYLETVNSEFTELPIIDNLSKEEALDMGSSRRDFLKYLGFGLGAAAVAAGCDTPIRRAIPYVVKPDEIVPGVATYYASSFVQGGDYCPVLVRTREGRPIKMDGNTLSSVTMGGSDARAQACVLSLYDTSRFRSAGRIVDGEVEAMSWADLDKAVKGKLNANSNIRILCNTVLSPTTKKVFEDFKAKYPNTEVLMYDPVSCSAMLEANEACFGEKVIPDYRFQDAKVIVSFDADFLGTWISPTEYTNHYTSNRLYDSIIKKEMSHHVQVESGMSVTGSNADNRILVKPSEQGVAIATLYNELAKLTGNTTVNAAGLNQKAAELMVKVAKELLDHKGECLVIAGSNNVGEQTLVNKINDMLGNYGKTIDFTYASLQRQGLDKPVTNVLVREMSNGGVDALFVVGGANPAFDLPNAAAFREGLAKVAVKVSFAGIMDETTALCDFIAPDHHVLESWGDVAPKKGFYSLIQPTIHPLFDSRAMGQTLLTWSESSTIDLDAEQPYYDYLRAYWQSNMFTQQSDYASFNAFWDSVLHDGIFEAKLPAKPYSGCNADVVAAASKINKPANSEFEVSFYETINMGAGVYSNNPWLQELPDPVTRCVWGNYLAVPVVWDGDSMIEGIKGIGRKNAKSKGDLVNLTVGGEAKEVVAIPQFGQMPGTLSLALGYGREVVGKKKRALGESVGVDVFPWISVDANGNTRYYATDVELSDIVGVEEEFACVQYHHTMGVTSVDETTNEEYNVDERALAYQGSLTDRSIIYSGNVRELDDLIHHIEHKREHAAELNSKTLYPYEEYKEQKYSQGHHWELYIDMNACTGCGACVIACMAENNIPVVGKREVHRHHEMTWLRIDRYYYGDIDNPSVVYQPMMCQHCDNAPCENVCPVAATNHSAEGLNQMTYNRCIGTRYCANNCPYKVRRFNWLDYTTADLFPGNQPNVSEEELPFGADNLTRMVLNPDVTVRTRGVIEKCSFCVQRIQEGKLTAKREGRRLKDSDIVSACQNSCPTGGIVFGDKNDENSELNKRLRQNKLVYKVLEEVNTEASVSYVARVNNRDPELDA